MTPRESVVAIVGFFEKELDLVVDIWRVQNPITKGFTWSQKSLQDFVASSCILPAIKSGYYDYLLTPFHIRQFTQALSVQFHLHNFHLPAESNSFSTYLDLYYDFLYL